MRFSPLTSAAFLLVLSWPAWLCTQAQSSTPSVPQATGDTYPDQGYLSDSRYTNQYFGFALDLPPAIQWQPVHRPVAPDGHLQLLELEGPAPQHATISITAYPHRDKNDPSAWQMLRKELDNELFYGVEELRGLTRTTIGKQQFYLYETRRGIDQHYFLAADLDRYVLHVVLAGRDDKLVNQLNAAFAATRFFDPTVAREYAGADAKAYEGPAMSSHRLMSLKDDPPAKHVDPGTITGDEYHNQELGLTYFLPAGWTLGTEPAVSREVERLRQSSGDAPAIGPAEAELVRACEKVLFSAWKEPAGANGKVAYDGFGEVTLSAMSLACFPDLRFPGMNAAEVKAFLAQFALTHPLMRDVRQGRAFERSGQVFVEVEGVIAFQVEGDALSRRLSIAMLMTQDRDYLLTWFFAAPHQSELRELMDAKLTLTTEPTRNNAERELSDGGGTPATTGDSSNVLGNLPPPSATAAPSKIPGRSATTTSATADPAAAAQPANASSSASSTAPANAQASEAPSSQPPSLLRPGETMNEQQTGGSQVPKKH